MAVFNLYHQHFIGTAAAILVHTAFTAFRIGGTSDPEGIVLVHTIMEANNKPGAYNQVSKDHGDSQQFFHQ